LQLFDRRQKSSAGVVDQNVVVEEVRDADAAAGVIDRNAFEVSHVGEKLYAVGREIEVIDGAVEVPRVDIGARFLSRKVAA